MTVADNIEFALRVRRMGAAERRRRRQELLHLVALEGYDDRYPAQLSGGQQQRVAVARALAHEPAVLLLDEPFGALDAKIRVELRETVRAVQRRIGMTTILVTHDQEEAFALADRIGVMQMGRLLEIGTPEDLYRHPATRFVARFLGAANLFLGEVSQQGLHLGAATLTPERVAPLASSGAEAVLVVRPEDIEVAPADSTPESRPFASGVVRALTFAGHQQHVSIQLAEQSGVQPATGNGHDGGAAMTVDALRSAVEQSTLPLAVGAGVSLGVRRMHALPTPISSFHVMARDQAESDALAGSAVLAQLVRSMQARVIRHGEQGSRAERLDAGICVLPLRADTPAAVRIAIENGARRILCIPASAPLPLRMLIHAGDAARRGDLLALVSSVMRHLPVETHRRDRAARRGQPERSARGSADAAAIPAPICAVRHGLDLRGERFVGDRSAWLSIWPRRSEPVLVVMGLPGRMAELSGSLPRDHAPLFGATSRATVLFAIDATS